MTSLQVATRRSVSRWDIEYTYTSEEYTDQAVYNLPVHFGHVTIHCPAIIGLGCTMEHIYTASICTYAQPSFLHAIKDSLYMQTCTHSLPV